MTLTWWVFCLPLPPPPTAIIHFCGARIVLMLATPVHRNCVCWSTGGSIRISTIKMNVRFQHYSAHDLDISIRQQKTP
jgi:hypothetical protein